MKVDIPEQLLNMPEKQPDRDSSSFDEEKIQEIEQQQRKLYESVDKNADKAPHTPIIYFQSEHRDNNPKENE